MIKSLDIGRPLDSHDMVKTSLLASEPRLVVIALGLLGGLFHLIFAFLNLLSFSLRHSLSWRHGLCLWDACIRSGHRFGLSRGEIHFVVFIGSNSPDRWPLLLEDWFLQIVLHFSILDESLHPLNNVRHLEDLGCRGPVCWVLSQELED